MSYEKINKKCNLFINVKYKALSTMIPTILLLGGWSKIREKRET